MATVGSAIKEDLGRVKDVLDIFVRTGMNKSSELVPQLELLKKISDTLGVLGLGELRGDIDGEIDRLRSVVERGGVAKDLCCESRIGWISSCCVCPCRRKPTLMNPPPARVTMTRRFSRWPNQ